MKKQKTILITGASSGIGKAVAIVYAAPDVTLFLTGRNADRLKEVEALCRQKGATVETATVNVTDRAALEEKILGWDRQSPVDIVIANAGVSGGSAVPAQKLKSGPEQPGMDAKQTEARLREIIDTNLIGTFNTVNPLIPLMQSRKQGQIVLMSSMAGFRGMPNAPAYSTSKVAVRAYGDALRPLLKKDGLSVSIIFPGFVKTPLTDVNTFPMPFMMDAGKAAQIIKDGIDAKKAFIVFPWQMHIFCWLLGVMPRRAGDWFLSKAPKKG